MDNINKVFEITKFKDNENHREYVMEDLYKSFLQVYDMNDNDDSFELFDWDILKYFQYTSIHKEYGVVII